MNVLSLVSYNFLPAKMGGQKNIALHNAYLSKLVNLVCVTTCSNDVKFATYKVINILGDSFIKYYNAFYFFSLRRIIKEEKITHLIIEHPYWGWLGFLLKHFCKVKFVTHSHNIESIRFKSLNKWWWKILWFYEKWVHQQADFSLFITDEDRNFAKENYKIDFNKSAVTTYGIELDKIISDHEKQNCKQFIQTKYNIADDEKIILFNGTLDYAPNENAIETIINQINPNLQLKSNYKYKILICGKNLPQQFHQLQHQPNIIYCGLVDDIDTYFKAADIFINPVTDGGGIKTKVIEALAYNVSVVSTKSGANGIPEEIVNGKLLIVNDDDWEAFSHAIISIDNSLKTPEAFYTHFYWGNIAQKTYQNLQQI